MRLNVTIYVHCRSRYILVLFSFTGQIIFNCFTWTLSNKLSFCNTFRVGAVIKMDIIKLVLTPGSFHSVTLYKTSC